MTIPSKLNVLNYPIETEEAKKFWASKHKCNQVKSIIAFSLNEENANDNLRRYGYTYQWRKKALAAFGHFVNQPTMKGIPFTETSTPYWECMPASGSVLPPPEVPLTAILSVVENITDITIKTNGAGSESKEINVLLFGSSDQTVWTPVFNEYVTAIGGDTWDYNKTVDKPVQKTYYQAVVAYKEDTSGLYKAESGIVEYDPTS